MSKQIAKFNINGRTYEVLIEPQTILVDLLRDQLDLMGTRLNCGVGECGACTVLIDGKLNLACSRLAITAAEKDILTIEGLAKGTTLHPIQKAFAEYGAIQCGFCTPGMILSAKALLDSNPNPTKKEVQEALAGNLCRCTGYLKIVDAVLAAADAMGKGGLA